VHPGWARRGSGGCCSSTAATEARAAGLHAARAARTLPGEPLYAALGFTVRERVTVTLPDGAALGGAVMHRAVDD
jgi:hypothetical protein